MASYLTDANLTDQLPALTNAAGLDTSAERLAKCITPASSIVDGWFPYHAPFAAITDSPDTPDLVIAGATQIAKALAWEILAGSSESDEAKQAWATAMRIFQVTPPPSGDGLAHVQIVGDDAPERFGVVDVTRSIDDEERDEAANRSALYP